MVKLIVNRRHQPEEIRDLEWTLPDVKTAAGYHPSSNMLDLMIGQKVPWVLLRSAGCVFWNSKESRDDCLFSSVEDALCLLKKHENPLIDIFFSEISGELNPRALEFLIIKVLI